MIEKICKKCSIFCPFYFEESTDHVHDYDPQKDTIETMLEFFNRPRHQNVDDCSKQISKKNCDTIPLH